MNKVNVHFDGYNLGCSLHIQNIYTVRIFKKVVLYFQYPVYSLYAEPVLDSMVGSQDAQRLNRARKNSKCKI